MSNIPYIFTLEPKINVTRQCIYTIFQFIGAVCMGFLVCLFFSLCNFAPSILKVSLGNENEFEGRKPPLLLLLAGTGAWSLDR